MGLWEGSRTTENCPTNIVSYFHSCHSAHDTRKERGRHCCQKEELLTLICPCAVTVFFSFSYAVISSKYVIMLQNRHMPCGVRVCKMCQLHESYGQCMTFGTLTVIITGADSNSTANTWIFLSVSASIHD